jgi:hypothetical protein
MLPGDHTRRLTLSIAVIGFLALIGIVGLGLYLSPPAIDHENNPEAEEPAPQPKPAKKPPLD